MFKSFRHFEEEVKHFLHPSYKNPYYRNCSLDDAEIFSDIPAYFAIPIAKFIEVHFPILEKILTGMCYQSIWELLKSLVCFIYNDYVILKNDNTSRVGCNQPVIFLRDVLHMDGTLVINGLYHVMASGFYRCLSVIITAFDGHQPRPDFEEIPQDFYDRNHAAGMVAEALASADTTDPENRLINLSQEIEAIDDAHDLTPFPKDAFAFTGWFINFRMKSLIRSYYCR